MITEKTRTETTYAVTVEDITLEFVDKEDALRCEREQLCRVEMKKLLDLYNIAEQRTRYSLINSVMHYKTLARDLNQIIEKFYFPEQDLLGSKNE